MSQKYSNHTTFSNMHTKASINNVINETLHNKDTKKKLSALTVEKINM